MSSEGRTLLIVDDDAPFRDRLVRAMRERGFDARGAADHRSGHRNGAGGQSRAGARRPASGQRVGRGARARAEGRRPLDGGRGADRLRQHRHRGGERQGRCRDAT